MAIYTKQDRNKPGITLVALVDENGSEVIWCAVDIARRKVLARQAGISTAETLERIGYRKAS